MTDTDRSLEILNDLAGEYPYMKVIARPQRSGQSAALKEGLDASRGEWVAMMDADLRTLRKSCLHYGRSKIILIMWWDLGSAGRIAGPDAWGHGWLFFAGLFFWAIVLGMQGVL